MSLPRRPLRLFESARRRAVELTDALLATDAMTSLPRLSLAAGHRRKWASISDVLTDGRIEADRLREVLAARPLAGGQPIYAVDVSEWPRCDAEASPERGFS